MGCNCGKPKCDGHCGVSPAVLQINNPSECVLFHRVEVPASMGDSKTNPPKSGAYKNTLLYYKADGEAFLYSSDGIPTKITGVANDYACLENKPQINGVTLEGNKSLSDIGVTDAISNALESYTPTSDFATVATSGSYNDLSDKPTIPAAQVNSDWNAVSGVAQILNKPTIPTVNDATLTITQNGTSAGTFTANASSNATINLTDTTYSDFSGATSSVAGASGLVPAPTAGDEDKALKGDGTWSVVGDVVELFVNKQPGSLSTPFKIYKDWDRTVPITHSEMRELFIPSNKKTVVLHDTTSYDGVYPVIEFCYDTTEFYIFDAINSATYYIVSAPGGGNTDFSITRTDLQKKLTAGSNITISGDTISASAGLVEMSYGESNAWAKFIAAYQSNKIVYCRVSSNSNPSTGAQGRKAFMAYVNNAENPTEVEFQYVRSVSTKTASQPVDQVYVYKLTNASGGTWTVETRNMAPKLAAGTNTTVSYSNGTYTISATGGGGGGPTVVQAVGTSTTSVMSQNAVTGLIYHDPSTRGTISIGTTNGYEVTGGIQIGDGALAPEDYSIAIGYNARGSDGGYPYKGIAIGANAYVYNEGGVAIGADTNIQAGHSVAIGDKSYVGSLDNEYVVSVGRPSNVSNPFTRRIINVTDPINAQDAATKNYVDTVVGNIETILQTLNSGNGAQ